MKGILTIGKETKKTLERKIDISTIETYNNFADIYFEEGKDNFEKEFFEEAMKDFSTSYNISIAIKDFFLKRKERPENIHNKVYNSAIFYGRSEFEFNGENNVSYIQMISSLDRFKKDCKNDIISLYDPKFLKWFNQWIDYRKNDVDEIFGYKIEFLNRRMQEEVKKENYENAAIFRDKLKELKRSIDNANIEMLYQKI